MSGAAAAILDDHRKRVKDDAFELIVAAKIVAPLLPSKTETGVPSFLRRVLSRHIVLGITRLLAPPVTGKTGTTASLRSLLQLASRDNILRPEFILVIKTRLLELGKKIESEGFTVKDLHHLRTTQIAHTLVPHQIANDVWLSAVLDVADALFEVTTQIERALVEAGCRPLADTSSAPEKWKAKSLEFWARKGN